MSGALSHIRVLDLSRILAGPWAGQMLGDLGAEVIKIERPRNGDDTRSWGPPYLKAENGLETSEAAYYLCTNRNKKSVTVDIAHKDGQDIIRQLAMQSDILLENFKVGQLKKYGLDYETLKSINPRLIYCSITGFGQTGPYATRAGYDFLMQGMGGLMSITGRADSEPGAGPQKVGVALTDVLTGLHAVVSVLAALAHRETSGTGQHIDLALLDVQVSCLANQNMNYLTTGLSPVRMGNNHPNIVPYQDFPTSDGYMIIAVGNDAQFARLCDVLRKPEWATDERFATNDGRVKNRVALDALLNAQTSRRPSADWISELEDVGVPCGPINSIAQVFEDPQIKARGLKIEIPHPSAGTVPLVGSPIRMSETPVTYRAPPPLLGQDTDDVLRTLLHFDSAALAALKGKGIIA